LKFAAAPVVACVAALTLVLSARGQEQQQPPPRFRVEANFVRVDAYPVKDGKPVLGLNADDFEVYEDGALQKIDTFEHVVVRPADPGQQIDPGSQRAALQAVANPRNRVFVIFLDTNHVYTENGHWISKPLIHLIDRMLGPDDLVALMTPEMSASQIVFARKTQVIQDGLWKHEPWMEKFLQGLDDREKAYEACYGPVPKDGPLQEMLLRKRERATLEAVQDLVRYLRGIREERKAIITVTQGWLLYRENLSLMPKPGPDNPIAGLDPIGVGPTGKLGTKDPRAGSAPLARSECDADKMRLATMDDQQFFRDIMADANRANASFYPIDPRGLAAVDSRTIAEDLTPNIEIARVKHRVETLQTLAENTDGMAVVNTSDLDRGIRRVADDLTSYYLLGYYSSNSRLDGRFRALKVRVKQPGVNVRARHGYRAATDAEVNAARRATDAPVPEATRAVQSAIGRLDGFRPEARFRINAVTAGGNKGPFWVAGELQSPGGRPDEFALGATAEIEATMGSSSTTAQVMLKAGERTFLTMLQAPSGGTGEVSVRARLKPVDGAATPLQDAVRLAADASASPLYFRRGATTGNKLVAAADLRFSRTERVRLEIPVRPDVKAGAGRLLDRAGQPLEVPVTVSERTDEATGQRWVAADINLGPLAPGDYGVEMAIGSERIVTAIRVTR
jgi:VWFA-related protein